jgi:tetratricopeptide (TPR) repeat protein
MRRLHLIVLILAMPHAARAQDKLRPADQSRKTAEVAVDDSSAFGNALRLARMLNDDAVVARLLRMRAASPDAPPTVVLAAVQALEVIGDPAAAASMLEARIAARPTDAASYVMLAELRARAGESRAAIAVWKNVQRRFGLTAAHAVEYARALSRVGDVEEAHAVLAATRAKADDDADEFWEALGDLSWELDDDAVALVAYRTLYKRKPAMAVAAERLMTLAAEAGAVDEAIKVALADFASKGRPQSLLFAAEEQHKKGDYRALAQTLALAELEPAGFVGKEEYWLLKAESYQHAGQAARAIEAYETALRINPSSVTPKAAILSSVVEQKDTAQLRRWVEAWRTVAETEPELWGPYALGLDRLGRTREALRFYERQLVHSPGDDQLILEYADALERTGNGARALELRRGVFPRLREKLLALAKKKEDFTLDERRLAETYVAMVKATQGTDDAERWFDALIASQPRTADREEFVVEWYLDGGRFDRARRRLLTSRGTSFEPATWRRDRLTLALADDDYATVKDLLAEPGSLDPHERIDALVELQRDDLAGVAIRERLEHGVSDADEPALRRQLDEIHGRHAPYARGGATYEYVTGAQGYGPDAAAAHDLGDLRILYGAAGRQLESTDATYLVLPSPRLEVTAFVTGRSTAAHRVTELAVGVNYQPSQPLPTLSLFDQRRLFRDGELSVQASGDSTTDDTSFLRVGALRSQVLVNLRVELPFRTYASGELEAREDHTHLLHFLGSDVSETIEAGYRLLERAPDWEVGVQAVASQRSNVSQLPADVATLRPAGTDLGLLLPPSYELVSVVTHLGHGDFLERYRPDRGAFPRYECEAGVGVLLPDLDGAVHAKCSLSARAPVAGYVSATAAYNRGVVGIQNQTNAIAQLWYTLPL